MFIGHSLDIKKILSSSNTHRKAQWSLRRLFDVQKWQKIVSNWELTRINELPHMLIWLEIFGYDVHPSRPLSRITWINTTIKCRNISAWRCMVSIVCQCICECSSHRCGLFFCDCRLAADSIDDESDWEVDFFERLLTCELVILMNNLKFLLLEEHWAFQSCTFTDISGRLHFWPFSFSFICRFISISVLVLSGMIFLNE